MTDDQRQRLAGGAIERAAARIADDKLDLSRRGIEMIIEEELGTCPPHLAPAIGRAVQRCFKASEDWRGERHPPDEEVFEFIISQEITPVIDTMLSERDKRIGELEHKLWVSWNDENRLRIRVYELQEQLAALGNGEPNDG